jgi:Na+/melibiose symporter-like transporter
VSGALRAAGNRLPVPTKVALATGDLATNTTLASLTLVFVPYFLIEVGDLRPALAGLVPFVARVVDAITDPLMGRISDRTRWRRGRRRPYFLLGAVPFGLTFALLWTAPPLASEGARCAYYMTVYVLLSLATTVVSVPYLALLPEMALDYDERTSVNTYRHVASVFGIVAALGLRPLAASYGGGAAGFAVAGGLYGVLVALPWVVVYVSTWERPEFRARPAVSSLREGLVSLARHSTYRQLTALYLTGRMAIDLVGALLLLYFTHWIGRSGDFEPAMLIFLAAVIGASPVWLALTRRYDKAAMFRAGALVWMAGQFLLLAVQPDWPRGVALALGLLLGVGYAVVDFMPWAMIGDVVDEDDLAYGERREGLYNGSFGFLRKVAGAAVVLVALGILDLAGFRKGAQPDDVAIQAIRYLTALGPACLLAVAVWLARGYPLGRERHGAIARALAARRPGPST